MIKVKFFKKIIEPESKLEVYTSITRIPFSLKLDEKDEEHIYNRYIVDGNFIEFRFNKKTKELHDINLISINGTIPLSV